LTIEKPNGVHTSLLDLASFGENHGVLLGGQLLVIREFPPGMTPAAPPEASKGALRALLSSLKTEFATYGRGVGVGRHAHEEPSKYLRHHSICPVVAAGDGTELHHDDQQQLPRT
jgi:hypothetical protein